MIRYAHFVIYIPNLLSNPWLKYRSPYRYTPPTWSKDHSNFMFPTLHRKPGNLYSDFLILNKIQIWLVLKGKLSVIITFMEVIIKKLPILRN